jgi:N-acetylglucosamine kinase-like BadF-type ATPase
MKLFLAVDAGGTKTDYLLADETRELARARGGTIKRMRVDAAAASGNLDAALAELAAKSGVSMQSVSRTCIGTAGDSIPLVVDWLREAMGARVGGELLLLGDVEIALDAAFPGASGVLVLAGTGSNVAGRMSDGTLTFAGGWGPVLADQGSGHKIGVECLRAIFMAKDEGRSTTLLEAVLEFWELASLDALVEYGNRILSPDFSRLTDLTLRCAEQGDAVAMEVLRREGEGLGHLVKLVVGRLLMGSGEVSPLAFAGSIMEKVAPVREALIASVREEYPEIRVLDGVVDSLVGALWRARGEGV